MVFVGSELYEAGADGINLDTVGGTGDPDFKAALLTTEKLKKKYPEICVEIGMAGDSTAIGSALGTCIKRLKDIESKSKVVILLTDGRNNAGAVSPKTAAEIARTYNIKVYTIGAGTEGEAPFLVDSFFGKQYVADF